jgi:serine/threonine-protein kinase
VIAAPLRAGPGEVAGMMAVVTDRARSHGAGERTDLRALAARLTRELQQVASYRRLVAEEERLRAGTSTDSLTHALTRTAFEQAVGNELAAAARRGEPLALVLLDIVGLRRINLEHGHPAGDEVLAQLASRVRGALRPSDLLARFGGDELALLLVNTTVEQARALAEDVRVRISGAPVAVGGEGSVAVSLRVVIAPLDPAERSGEACFARAVGALRAARPDAVTVVAADARVPEADVALDQASLAVGATLGGSYRILHELSRGAMGVVYRGEDIGLGRPVAIKVLRSDLALDRELVGRFRAEAAMLASLHHPNLVQIYALGEQAGDVYFVMELVEGQPLSEVLRTMLDRRQWMPAAAVAQIAVEIADALDAMHQVGVIHRDVKPGNVLLDRANGRAVLVDVGVATRTGVRGEGAGTPGFAAPESLALGAGETVTASESIATDVYGLAATVYSLLTGRTPFGSGNVMAVVARQLSEPLTPPSTHRPELTRAVDEVLAKALDPVPRRRWASASSFAVALARALEKVREGDADAGRITAEMVAERPTNLPTPTPLAASDKAAAMVTEVLPDGLAPTIGPQRGESGRLHGIDGDLRGAHFRVAARGITSRLGEQVLRTLIDSSPQLARVLSPSLPALGWEPIEAFVELLDRTASLMAPDDLARMVGRATIHATFARFFGANPASLPVETVMRAAPTFWGRYHSWSRLELGLAAPRHVELSLLGESLPPLCALTGAQLVRVAELAGARDVALSHARCRSLGAPECSFVLAWS